MSQGFTRGVPIDTDPNLTANSNLLVPSQAAIVAYVASHAGTGGGGGSGTVTSITGGTGLVNTTITVSGTLEIDTTKVPYLAGGFGASSGLLKWNTGTSTWTVDTTSYLTGNQSITLSGDATGTGSTSIPVTLANSGVTAGSYGTASLIPAITVDSKGRITSISTNTLADTSNTFTQNYTVYLTGGKTFGKYVNGATVPANGKTAKQVIIDAFTEVANPNGTVALSNTTSGYRSSTTIWLNQIAVSNVLNFTNSANAPSTSISTAVLQWRRGGSGPYTVLGSITPATASYTHTLADSTNNTQPFNYQYIITDNNSAVSTISFDVTPTHTPPTGTYQYLTTSAKFPTNYTVRERGDNAYDYYSAIVYYTNPNITPTSFSFQYSFNNSTWTTYTTYSIPFGSGTNMTGSISIAGSTYLNASVIYYRWQVVDSTGTYTVATGTVNFYHKNMIIYSTASSLSLSDISAATNSTLSFTDGKVRTFSGVTSGAGNYTYYVYSSNAGNLTGVIMDGAAPVLGAFTNQGTLTGTNTYGATVSYIVYRSNATNAFTNNTLAFS